MLTMLAFCGGLTRHASTAAEAMASDRKCCRSRSSAKMWPSAWPLTTRANGRVPLTGLRTWMMRSAAPGCHKGPHQVRGDVPKHSHASTMYTRRERHTRGCVTAITTHSSHRAVANDSQWIAMRLPNTTAPRRRAGQAPSPSARACDAPGPRGSTTPAAHRGTKDGTQT